VRYRYDDVRASDVLSAWLQHLLLCAEPAPGAALRTTWQARDARFSLRPCENPREVLRDLLVLYERGLSEPLMFFPKSAWKYVRKNDSASAAAGVWRSTKQHPFGEETDAAYRLALRGLPDPMGEGFAAFATCAHAVFDPLLLCLDDAELP